MYQARGTPEPAWLEALPCALTVSIMHRRKGTFTLPYVRGRRGTYRAVADDRLLPSRRQARALFDPVAVQHLWKSFVAVSLSLPTPAALL